MSIPSAKRGAAEALGFERLKVSRDVSGRRLAKQACGELFGLNQVLGAPSTTDDLPPLAEQLLQIDSRNCLSPVFRELPLSLKKLASLPPTNSGLFRRTVEDHAAFPIPCANRAPAFDYRKVPHLDLLTEEFGNGEAMVMHIYSATGARFICQISNNLLGSQSLLYIFFKISEHFYEK